MKSINNNKSKEGDYNNMNDSPRRTNTNSTVQLQVVEEKEQFDDKELESTTITRHNNNTIDTTSINNEESQVSLLLLQTQPEYAINEVEQEEEVVAKITAGITTRSITGRTTDSICIDSPDIGRGKRSSRKITSTTTGSSTTTITTNPMSSLKKKQQQQQQQKLQQLPLRTTTMSTRQHQQQQQQQQQVQQKTTVTNSNSVQDKQQEDEQHNDTTSNAVVNNTTCTTENKNTTTTTGASTSTSTSTAIAATNTAETTTTSSSSSSSSEEEKVVVYINSILIDHIDDEIEKIFLMRTDRIVHYATMKYFYTHLQNIITTPNNTSTIVSDYGRYYTRSLLAEVLYRSCSVPPYYYENANNNNPSKDDTKLYMETWNVSYWDDFIQLLYRTRTLAVRNDSNSVDTISTSTGTSTENVTVNESSNNNNIRSECLSFMSKKVTDASSGGSPSSKTGGTSTSSVANAATATVLSSKEKYAKTLFYTNFNTILLSCRINQAIAPIRHYLVSSSLLSSKVVTTPKASQDSETTTDESTTSNLNNNTVDDEMTIQINNLFDFAQKSKNHQVQEYLLQLFSSAITTNNIDGDDNNNSNESEKANNPKSNNNNDTKVPILRPRNEIEQILFNAPYDLEWLQHQIELMIQKWILYLYGNSTTTTTTATTASSSEANTTEEPSYLYLKQLKYRWPVLADKNQEQSHDQTQRRQRSKSRQRQSSQPAIDNNDRVGGNKNDTSRPTHSTPVRTKSQRRRSQGLSPSPTGSRQRQQQRQNDSATKSLSDGQINILRRNRYALATHHGVDPIHESIRIAQQVLGTRTTTAVPATATEHDIIQNVQHSRRGDGVGRRRQRSASETVSGDDEPDTVVEQRSSSSKRKRKSTSLQREHAEDKRTPKRSKKSSTGTQSNTNKDKVSTVIPEQQRLQQQESKAATPDSDDTKRRKNTVNSNSKYLSPSYQVTTSQRLEFDTSESSSDDDDDDEVESYTSDRVQLPETPPQTYRTQRVYKILPDKWMDNNLPIPDENIFNETGHVLHRRRWTTPEKLAIKQGIQKYKNDWISIKKHYAQILRNRTNVQCKDCYRTMVRLGECDPINM